MSIFFWAKPMQAPPVTINGTLRVPEGGVLLPVIILLHGTDGPQSTAVNVMREIPTERDMPRSGWIAIAAARSP